LLVHYRVKTFSPCNYTGRWTAFCGPYRRDNARQDENQLILGIHLTVAEMFQSVCSKRYRPTVTEGSGSVGNTRAMHQRFGCKHSFHAPLTQANSSATSDAGYFLGIRNGKATTIWLQPQFPRSSNASKQFGNFRCWILLRY
jgi:hypothetical protein